MTQNREDDSSTQEPPAIERPPKPAPRRQSAPPDDAPATAQPLPASTTGRTTPAPVPDDAPSRKTWGEIDGAIIDCLNAGFGLEQVRDYLRELSREPTDAPRRNVGRKKAAGQ